MAMLVCESCGNAYDKPFVVTLEGEAHAFDCFECAIEKLAPRCGHCGTRIIGHGLEKDARIYCCAHCASAEGAVELQDRA